MHVNQTDHCIIFMHSSCLPAILQRTEKALNENYVLNVVVSFSMIVCCLRSCRYLMSQKLILSEPKWGAQAVALPGPPVSMALLQSNI